MPNRNCKTALNRPVPSIRAGTTTIRHECLQFLITRLIAARFSKLQSAVGCGGQWVTRLKGGGGLRLMALHVQIQLLPTSNYV